MSLLEKEKGGEERRDKNLILDSIASGYVEI
jgi:hypothetical protein